MHKIEILFESSEYRIHFERVYYLPVVPRQGEWMSAQSDGFIDKFMQPEGIPSDMRLTNAQIEKLDFWDEPCLVTHVEYHVRYIFIRVNLDIISRK